jgi:hypothetical protein
MADPKLATPQQRSRDSVRTRQRWWTVGQAVAVALGLGILVWGADALARTGAESLIARNVQDATGVPERPEVAVHGLFFLPQVIRGAYNEVDVTTRGITSGTLRLERVDSHLVDVRVPFHDVLVRDISRIGIGRSVEEVTLRYEDLNAYLQATGRPLQLSSAGGDEVRIIGSVDVLDRTVEASADVVLSAENGLLRIEPRQIDSGGSVLSEASRLLLGQRLTLTVPLGALPFGHVLTDVQLYEEGMRIVVEGDTIILRP